MHRRARTLLAGVVLLGAMLGPSTARAATAPPPLPDSMAALGDSITQAVDVCCFYGSWPSHSWSTGWLPFDGITSHYERIRARHPAILGRRDNDAVSGARMADAPAQARQAAEQRAEYVTVLMGANDLCGGAGALTSPASFRRDFTATLAILAASPARPYVLVASIPNLHQLWSVLHTDPAARLVWRVAGICPSILGADRTEDDRQAVVARERAFNGILADVCAAVPRCRFDGGRVYNLQVTKEMVSRLDYFHPSLAGQAVLAAETWKASWWGS
jgi:lysophospholipase L1-like esterase